MKYLVCKDGNRITVKRADRCWDFGEIIAEHATQEAANICAKAERLLRKHIEQGHGIFSKSELRTMVEWYREEARPFPQPDTKGK